MPADATKPHRERERALRVAVYICTRRIPPNVADFVCSRVRRVGAFERRIRFLSSRAPTDRGKLPRPRVRAEETFSNYLNLLQYYASIYFTSQWDAKLYIVRVSEILLNLKFARGTRFNRNPNYSAVKVVPKLCSCVSIVLILRMIVEFRMPKARSVIAA